MTSSATMFNRSLSDVFSYPFHIMLFYADANLDLGVKQAIA
jgi:hypothetical protein